MKLLDPWFKGSSNAGIMCLFDLSEKKKKNRAFFRILSECPLDELTQESLVCANGKIFPCFVRELWVVLQLFEIGI